MKFINFIIKIIDKIINIVVTLFLVFILFIGLYAIYDYYYITHEGTLSKDIINLQGEDPEEPITLEKLKETNKDIIGWIKINDTVVDYPILIGDDNNEYLYADYNKNYAVTGSIFMDYRNKDTFTDEYSIIYGHNMYSGQMFGSFLKYRDRDYLLKHSKGTIMADKTYNLEIIGYSIKSAYDDIYDLKMTKNELYDYYKKDATVFVDKPLANDEGLLILSTCDSANRNDRRILLVKYKEVIEEKDEEIPKEVTESKTTITQKENNNKITNLVIIICSASLFIIFIVYIIIKLILNKKVKKSNENIDNEIDIL